MPKFHVQMEWVTELDDFRKVVDAVHYNSLEIRDCAALTITTLEDNTPTQEGSTQEEAVRDDDE